MNWQAWRWGALSSVWFGIAFGLPFLGLERFEGDQTPIVLALAALAIGIGFVVRRWRPWALEDYVSGAAMVFVVLCLLGMIGLLSTMPASSYESVWMTPLRSGLW